MKDNPSEINLNTMHSRHLILLQYVIYGSVILYFGRDFFIPLAFATLISFVLHPVCSWLELKGFGRMTAILIGVSIIMILFLGLVALLVKQFFDFLHEWPTIQIKLMKAFHELGLWMSSSFGISDAQQDRWISQATDEAVIGAFAFLQRTISFSAVSFIMLILIPVYSVLLLFYRNLWIKVIFRIFPQEKKEHIKEILSLTIQAYYNFIKGMGLVYLIVGILNSLGLFLIGVPHAILFGFMASVLTFIPYIGILVGSLLPIAMAWITYDSIWYPFGIVAIFTFVQYLEANLIFPFAVSNKLNVNTLAVLVAIFVGGLLWGLAGMILFVPFVGIIKLIADHNHKLKTLAMALGTNR